MKIIEFADSVEPTEVADNESSYLDVHVFTLGL